MQAGEEASVGLCGRCRLSSEQRSARGSHFWRCGKADADPAFPRYPPLPVLRCPGFEEGGKLVPRRGASEPGAPGRERGER